MYRVLISTDVEKTRMTSRDHTVIGEEYEEGQEKPKKIYGWPDQVEERVIVEVKVLEQQVEEIDLPRVIAAINGLKLAES